MKRGLGPIALAIIIIICPSVLSGNARSRPSSGAHVVLDSSVTILVESDQPTPVQLAAQDLASDFKKVFGSAPAIVTRTTDASPVTVLIGSIGSPLVASLHPDALSDPEAFSISTATARWKKGALSHVVVLTGADVRGTMYAVYHFSQEFLGVDPMYYWTDNEPPRRPRIDLPTSLRKTYAPPVFKYRGFFINGEDLLTGWAPGEQRDHTGIALDVWNHIFETILRLKGNVVIPGSWIFPDEPQVKLASRRGLIIAQHQNTPLGVNVARWPKDVPYSYTEHPEILERAWTNAVSEYSPDQEVLWTLGLRGLSDMSYADADANVEYSDEKLGGVITAAIADEIRIVRAVRPKAHFVMNLWQEGARLQHEGYLDIPPEVTTVWPDAGYGYLQDQGHAGKGQGAYYHAAMYNQLANELTEMVPISRVDAELGRYIKAGATEYLLLNTGNIRPVAMTTNAVMDAAWEGLPDSTASDVKYYRRWSLKEFGKAASVDVASIYQEYFETPAKVAGTQPALPYGDNYYHTQARRLLMLFMIGSPVYVLPAETVKWATPSVRLDMDGKAPARWVQDTARAEIERCGDAQSRWDALWEKARAAEALVPAERKSAYEAHVLAMIAINKESNNILSLVAHAVLAAAAGQPADARDDAMRTFESFDRIKEAEAAAEYGKWTNWYGGDWLTGIYRTREMVQNFLDYLAVGRLPPPIFWPNWESTYHIMHYENDRLVDVH